MKLRSKFGLSLLGRAVLIRRAVIGVSLSLIVFLIGYMLFYWGNNSKTIAATIYQSQNEYKGFWENTVSWVGGTVPTTSDDYVINGSIVKNANLSLGNFQSLTVNTGDTLIIVGNLDLANKSILTVKNNAVLIVRGNYTTLNQTNDVVQPGGTLIIVGSLSFMGNGDITVNPGANIYYDKTQNPYAFSDIVGGGNSYDISKVPPSLFNDTYGTPLPITLSDFSATTSNGQIVLSWITPEELGVKYYEIQRSANGKDFAEIGKVEPKGGYRGDEKYTFIDQSALVGDLYYRIGIVDENNHLEYSSVIVVSMSNKPEIIVYPSVSDGQRMNFKGDIKNKSIKVLIYDHTGREVYTNNIQTNNLNDVTIDFSNRLNKGRYYIHFVYDNRIEKKNFTVGD